MSPWLPWFPRRLAPFRRVLQESLRVAACRLIPSLELLFFCFEEISVGSVSSGEAGVLQRAGRLPSCCPVSRPLQPPLLSVERSELRFVPPETVFFWCVKVHFLGFVREKRVRERSQQVALKSQQPNQQRWLS